MRTLLIFAVFPLLVACPEKCKENGCTAQGGGGAAQGGGAGGGGGTTPDAGNPTSLAAFCAEYPRKACEHILGCGRYSDAGLGVCLQRQVNELKDLCRRADAGYLGFDGQRAGDCLSGLSATPVSCLLDFPACGDLEGPGLSSMRAGIFSQPVGGCGTSTCAAGTVCDERCTGPQCLPLIGLGQRCSDGTDGIINRCVPQSAGCGSRDGGATFCLPAVGTGETCLQGECGPADYCGFGSMPAVCTRKSARDVSCTFDTECIDVVCRMSDGRCGALDAGSRCVTPSDCGSFTTDQICLGLQVGADGGTLDAGVCGRKPLVGERCSRSWSRAFDACHFERGEACLDGVCVALTKFSLPRNAECPIRPYGYTAVPFFGFASCERGLVCLSTSTSYAVSTGICQPPLPRGSTCRDELDCVAGLTCLDDGSGRKCEPLPGLRQRCTTQCLRDLDCVPVGDGGRECAPPSPVDGGCSGFQTCVPEAQCVANTCELLGAAGTPCVYGFQCAGGACQLNRCVDQCAR